VDWTVNVAIHESVSPRLTRERILERLRNHELDPSLLYSGLRQTSRWVELHHAFSPAQQDAACGAIYAQAFAELSRLAKTNVAHVVSLGCGDGTKDEHCLRLLRESGRTVLYTPVDVSLEMLLLAQKSACGSLRGLQCTPLLCDLVHCSVLPAILKSFDPSGAQRFILLLGMIHNSRPADILRSVLYPLRSQDYLLVSANLAPAANYDQALLKILPQYDNPPTIKWLWGALSELDITSADGELRLQLEITPEMPGLKRIQADFIFSQEKRVRLFGEEIVFSAQDKLRVFHSSRFTEQHVSHFLKEANLLIEQTWIAPSGEEGLFLCRRAA
jgi:L-histidine Nalpha-methyltransferase